MRKLIVLITTILLLFSCTPYRKSFHKDQIFRYELEYKVHNPTTVSQKTFIFYSRYNSDENGGKYPKASLVWYKGLNHLYVDGLTFKEADVTKSYLLDYSKNPITVVGIKKTDYRE